MLRESALLKYLVRRGGSFRGYFPEDFVAHPVGNVGRVERFRNDRPGLVPERLFDELSVLLHERVPELRGEAFVPPRAVAGPFAGVGVSKLADVVGHATDW